MSINLSLSVILLVKGRDDHTKRWLDYMHAIRFPYKIIIADGEDDASAKALANDAQKNSNLDIQFYQFNTHSGYSPYYDMMSKAVSFAETDYVMLCDNDDFILPKALSTIINFLDSNHEYISAGGKIVNFHIDNYSSEAHGQEINLLRPYKYYRNDEPLECWEDQIKGVFQNFQPNFYNIFRTPALYTISSELAEFNFSDLDVMEFYIQLRSSTLGRSKLFEDHNHYLRQIGSSQIANDAAFFYDLIDRNLPSDIRSVAKKIDSVIDTHLDISELVHRYYAKHLNHLLAHTVLRYRFPRLFVLKQTIKSMLEYIPKFIKKPFQFFSQFHIKQKFYYSQDVKRELKMIDKIIHKRLQ